MGAAESSERLNGTETEEEKRLRESGGGSTRAATIAVAGAAVAAWGISRMLSKDTDTEVEHQARTTRIRTHGMEPSLTDQRLRRYEGSNSNRHVDYQTPFATPESKSAKKGIWFPPPPNGFKMNTDGGFRPTEGQYSGKFAGTLEDDAAKLRPSAYAGILRNHRGKCMKAYRGFIGLAGSLEAEILGILRGLELLADHGLEGATLENDCDQAVFWIWGENKSYGIPRENMDRCKEMIEKCRTLVRENSIAIKNIDRSANRCADMLVRIALREKNKDVQFDLPNEVKMLVDKDNTALLNSGILL